MTKPKPKEPPRPVDDLLRLPHIKVLDFKSDDLGNLWVKAEGTAGPPKRPRKKDKLDPFMTESFMTASSLTDDEFFGRATVEIRKLHDGCDIRLERWKC